MFKVVKRTTPHALASGLFVLLSVLFSFKANLMLTDTDFWWHLAAGDQIRAMGGIPSSDSFSFTANNYLWYNISWLWDVIYSWLNAQSPLYLPAVVTAIINALTLSILAGFMLKRGVGVVVALTVILLGLAPYAYMLTPRPHEVTFLFTVIFYAICAGNNRRLLPVLPLLMILWVNMHGGFLVGFIILGAYLLQTLLAKDKKSAGLFLLTILTCLVACMLNPLGIDIFEACRRTLSSALLPIISEWQPLQFDLKHGLHVIYLVIFLATFRFNKNTGIAEKLLSLLWAFSTYQHERNLPIFVLLSAPVMAINLQSIFAKSNWLAKKNEDYERDLGNAKVRKAAFVIGLFITCILISGIIRPYLNLNTPNTHPVEEAEFIKRNYPDKHFLNDYFQGGYLLYTGTKVFIDGRAETAYPDEVVQDYLKFHYTQPGWEEIIPKYQIDGVILPRGNPALPFFEANKAWEKVFEGALDVVYIKQQK